MTRLFNRVSEKARRKSLRNNLPQAEIILWSKLKSRQLMGFKFRRQYSIGSYIIDFYCPETKLAIEIDGDSHFRRSSITYDKERQSFIEGFGIQFLRFTNSDIYRNLNGVLITICETLEEKMNRHPLYVPLDEGDKSTCGAWMGERN
jgi:very-short-patch-repair endonuclease